MSNLIIAIALWCGNPEFNHKDTNECRQQIIECTSKDPVGNKFFECFKKQELK